VPENGSTSIQFKPVHLIILNITHSGPRAEMTGMDYAFGWFREAETHILSLLLLDVSIYYLATVKHASIAAANLEIPPSFNSQRVQFLTTGAFEQM
jgi:hypothetical protein